MNRIAQRAFRLFPAPCLAALVALTASACGTPRVSEVYRLSTTDAGAYSEVDATLNSTLTPAQQELRRVSLHVQAMRPLNLAHHIDSTASLAALRPAALPECAPSYLEELILPVATLAAHVE